MTGGHRCRWSGRLGMVCIASAAGVSPALAHDGNPYAPHDLWAVWGWEPWVIAGLALAAWLYGRGAYRLWQASAAGCGLRRWEAAAFGAGWLGLWVALISPIHALGNVLFSARMVQHEIIMVVAAPLLVLGRPLIPWLWGLPLPWRRGVGGMGRRRWVQRGWRALTHPLPAWSLHAEG
jgi:putative membrane protein